MYRKRRYGQDPHWLQSFYGGTCFQCGASIKPGDNIYYYPNTRILLCAADSCGGAVARDFEACVFDEAMYDS